MIFVHTNKVCKCVTILTKQKKKDKHFKNEKGAITKDCGNFENKKKM